MSPHQLFKWLCWIELEDTLAAIVSMPWQCAPSQQAVVTSLQTSQPFENQTFFPYTAHTGASHCCAEQSQRDNTGTNSFFNLPMTAGARSQWQPTQCAPFLSLPFCLRWHLEGWKQQNGTVCWSPAQRVIHIHNVGVRETVKTCVACSGALADFMAARAICTGVCLLTPASRVQLNDPK